MTATSGLNASTSTFQADRALRTLREHSAAWLRVPIEAKIEYLRGIVRRTAESASAMVEDSLRAKGADPSLAGEDWVSGPTIQARTVRVLTDTLEGIRRTGRVPIDPSRVSTRANGQVVLQVLPHDVWDRLLFPFYRGDVWLDPAVARDDLDGVLGSIYTKPETAVPGVAVVLGAGNVSSIAPLDAVHKLFVDGKVTIVKFSPVNEYIGPHMERIFADLIADGYLRTAYGPVATGEYLTHHPLVDEIHVTGSARTHDAIVFGAGPDGAARKLHDDPVLTKPVTSELGNVSPVIVVPGRWKQRNLRFHAEHLATQMVQNGGFNCISAKVIVLPQAWPQREEFLDCLRRVLASLPARRAYYPDAEERWEKFLASHAPAEVFGERAPGVTPPALLVGIDPESEHLAFAEEAFCSLAATTELPGADPAAFMEEAVAFCNRRLEGTLKATIIVDPETARNHRQALDETVAGLRYGSVAVNVWGAVTYALGCTPWGGFPGSTASDIQSGRGFVHNGLLVDRPQKSVVWAPFHQVPKPAWFVTHRNTARAMRHFAGFESDPSVRRLLRLTAASLRG